MKKTDKHITVAPNREKPSIDWTKPSGGESPDIKQLKDVWIDVDVKLQKAYIKAVNKTFYTMIISSGLDQTNDATPKGTFHIKPERGEWFFSEGYQEGAEYWVSWKNMENFFFAAYP